MLCMPFDTFYEALQRKQLVAVAHATSLLVGPWWPAEHVWPSVVQIQERSW